MVVSRRIIRGLLVFAALVPGHAVATTSDHSSYEILQQDFKTGPEVTRACLSCHARAAHQVMETIHWTWVCPKSIENGEPVGKVRVINNFCIALQSNEPRCTSCHAGYGWKDQDFDFTAEDRVDCLICHDGTGTYKKFPTDAGHPAYEPKVFGGKRWEPPVLSHVAQNVTKPNRDNCGACHFFGGGGEGVKHADLDASLFEPDRDLDVHMAAEGADFSCQDCHTAHEHQISGRCYSVPAVDEPSFEFPRVTGDSHIYCQSCHGNSPHDDYKLNNHLDRVSCQACHIPRVARKKATKMSWDWSLAGRMDEEGKPIKEADADGNVVYQSQKGAFTWNKNFIPEYIWFDGTAESVTVTSSIDDSKPVQINTLGGSAEDPRARIWPIKVHRGKQIYDPVNKRLVIPKLFGPKGSGAYWADFDWDASAHVGMEYVGLPFSGEIGFVETEMYWPINHMVAPAEHAVACAECHVREGGRLANLAGAYLPGRDRSLWLDRFGWLAVFLTFAGVFGHGGVRMTYQRLKAAFRGKRG